METQNAFVSVSRSHALEEFTRCVGKLNYQRKAVFPSEMFLFYKLARGFGPDDLIVESGVGFGGSTAYLAKLFPLTTIVSVDDDKYNQLDNLKRKFKDKRRNLSILKGDARRMLPAIVARAKASRVAALIDGPKRMAAIALANVLLRDARVQFVAVHDLPPEMARYGSYTSHDEAFRQQFGYLDDKVGAFRNFYPEGPGLTIFRHA